jgi:hypothetical protein
MPQQATAFGRSISPPNQAWVAKQPPEAILDPELPIIDTHHHFWDRPDHRYLLDELRADRDTGHNVIATVFLECRSMYRAAGPTEMRPVGETEFVAGIAAISESGGYGPTRVAAGIVGYADLTLGDRVEPVLEAHIRAGGGRFRGVRHSAGWDASEVIGNSSTNMRPHLYRQPEFRAGLARLTALGLIVRRVALPPAARRRRRAGAGDAGRADNYGPRRRRARLRPLRRQNGRGVHGLEERDDRARRPS